MLKCWCLRRRWGQIMSIRRVYVSEDKAELIRSLRGAENPTAPFQTYADVMTFAAVLGAKRGRKTPLGKTSRKEPDPIPQDQFQARGYEPVINLIAITDAKDAKILALDEESSNKRIQIFEEYANGGLEVLQNELQGSVDYTDTIVLLLLAEKDTKPIEDFDLSRFL